MSEQRRCVKIVKELRAQGDIPGEYHPMITALFKDAADRIDALASEVDALRQEGSDKG